ncbi:hypothetical protein [Paenibacillus sp. LK1]|uniref:hypothetical protein n=1 Tax=Paenibacillus sp. LK1 TaxID=2053014 RepID=UPI000C196DE9|nr:hypothetical protein [Paenibacillus sp. LK1]PIH59042.1 hypothetical protein CS562_13940 [Paenibacillus sp. LK1]
MALVPWCKSSYKRSFLEQKKKELEESGEYSRVEILGGKLYIERVCAKCSQAIDGYVCWSCN